MTKLTIEIKVPNKDNPEVVFIVVNFLIGDLVCNNMLVSLSLKNN